MNDNITITGRAGADPTFNTTAKGLHVASFSVATDYLKRDANGQLDRDNKETNWYRVVTFGQLASGVASAVRKGRTVMVSGRLHIVDWENDDGRKGTKVEIVAESVGLDLRWSGGAAAPSPSEQPAQQSTALSSPQAERPAEGTTDLASSTDSWINAGATSAAVLADAETPF